MYFYQESESCFTCTKHQLTTPSAENLEYTYKNDFPLKYKGFYAANFSRVFAKSLQD